MDRNLKIGIVGLGLIGGSIFKALCALRCNVTAVARSNQTIQQAKQYSENVSKSLETLKHCDIVFVCTPMNKVNEFLDKLDTILPSTAIVSDVSSIKKFVCGKKRNYKFIPTHPMAGTEFAGFAHSYESLFQGAKWIVTPCKNTDPIDVKKITDVIQVLGAAPVFSTPEEHDKAVALISHMPMLVSQALFKTAQNDNLALKIASSGFRDTTRLAMSNEEMAQDMITLNAENIQAALLSLYSNIGELLNKDYTTQIRDIKNKRETMYIDGRNIL